jgi:hypothetical protein
MVLQEDDPFSHSVKPELLESDLHKQGKWLPHWI